MVFMIFLIIVLLVYIGFLQYQLIKRRKRSGNSTNLKVKGQDQHNNVSTFSTHDTYFHEPFNPTKREDFFSEENLEFIFNEKNTKIFLHYTSDKAIADNILVEGFKFATSFYKTAEEVYNDLTDLVYKHNKMKPYGKYVIVICFDRKLYDNYLKEIQKISSYDVFVEQILTDAPVRLNDDEDVIYTLHNKFIKGYIDYKSGEITKNTEFEPSYYSSVFDENLKKFNR